MPWSALEADLSPIIPGWSGGRSRALPIFIGQMLRIYCLQQWYNLSDPGAEEALYDIMLDARVRRVWAWDACNL